MTHSKPCAVPYCRYIISFRAILIAWAILIAGCDKDKQEAGKSPPAAQTPSVQNVPPSPPSPQVQPPPQASASKPLTDIESLVAPIALYPDPLLAELLVASTYPLEIVQAARWLESKPDLATLNSKDWDASILRLASVPQVVTMMNDHLDWTTQLGDAFLSKPAEVMDAIQKLRKRAVESGFLKDTPEQKVTTQTVSVEQAPEAAGAVVTPAVQKKEVYTIAPAKADTVYVPQYNPEVVYQAPMAPAPPPATGYPASTVVNVNAASPAPSYYPTYPATTTTSSNDSWVNFASGAVVGGLLTWGLMEWTDDDDWDDYHHVSHSYGETVCHNGNCWHGGGGGYYGDRGNVNYNRNTNISGNEINIDRDGVFSQDNLRPSQQRTGWQPNPRHRRGQAYPDSVQQRLGGAQQPAALAGQRLGAAQTLPASARGFAEAGQRPAAGSLASERRPSSADVRQQLSEKSGAREPLGLKLAETRPAARDVQGQLGQGARDNALQGLKTSGQASRLDSRRGASSRRTAPAAGERQTRIPVGGAQAERTRGFSADRQSQVGQGRAGRTQQADRSQAFAGRQQSQQQIGAQRRSETARPNAFEASRNARATQSFSQRGASSFQRSSSAGNLRSSAGGGGFSRGGGGGGGFSRGGGGGGRRR